jgi:dTDP-glucose 4,6-dehydratase
MMGVYNLGSEVKLTTEELVMRVLEHFGKKELFDGYLEASRLKDQEHYELEYSKLKKLGWKQSYTFEEGIELTKEWFENNSNMINLHR